ncbi:MAG: DUF87 domain-containing protein [Candidatus Marinimicrobia bacterium]|nr:DUF87 domain-containing protein [Candidatus Neomarinimicrobiota bacterium]
MLAVFLFILAFSYLRISMFQPFDWLQEKWKGLQYRLSYYFRNRKTVKEIVSDESLIENDTIVNVEKKSSEMQSFGEDDDLPDIPESEDFENIIEKEETVNEASLLENNENLQWSLANSEESDSEDELLNSAEPEIETDLQNPPADSEGKDPEDALLNPDEEEETVDDFEVEEKRQDDNINYDKISQKNKRLIYKLPSVNLLNNPPVSQEIDPEELEENAKILTQTLADFGVSGKVTKVVPGPVVTLYEVEPATGVRVNRISVLADDIARVMSAKRIRIIAPIPGKNVVGVEIPNKNPEIVYFKSIVNSEHFTAGKSVLSIALGKMVNGKPFTFDLDKMPHILIAGTTGSGKSVCINTLIMSILYRAKPSEVKFIMVDPKKLELSIYKALVNYHLITSEDIEEYVITTPQNAVLALRSAEVEMERRYTILSEAKVRNIAEYNNKAEQTGEFKALPYIVVIIDELADLMITASREIEEPIARLAQMARAVGIHLVVATQRPSVDVITGVIRSNFPARIAFQVPTKIDSRTILDKGGAEKLLGKGDMLFLAPGTSEPIRVHNSFVILDEIESVLGHITKQSKENQEFILPSAKDADEGDVNGGFDDESKRDKLFDDALRLIVQHQQGSISLVQRRLRVGYSRAARLIDELEHAGIVGPFTGSKAREVLVGQDYLEHTDSFTNGSFDDDDDE